MISVYGYSDDVVCIEGDVDDEVSPGHTITVGTNERGVRITFKYSASKRSGAVWRGSVEQIDEGIPMFPVIISEAEPSGFPDPRSYSVKLTIDCPTGTPVIVGKRNLAVNTGDTK